MVFGTDKILPLLTIAIPTWNRSRSLNIALEHLLPQVANYSKQIEIIISDNGSDDDTGTVVTKFIHSYPQLNIISNKNAENLGFYGNLRKCRKLSSGKYFWVLSDDDYVCEDIISAILQQIQGSNDFAVIYLKNNTHQSQLRNYNSNRDQLLIQESYNIGLISSVIFLNKKEFDESIYLKYNNSAFLGFLLLLNSFNFNTQVIVIEGNCLKPANDSSKGINFFDIFINHMEHVIDYMHFLKLPGKIINKFRCAYLVNFIRRYYILFRAEKALKIGTFEISPIKEIEQWIHKSYSNLKCYWLHFYLLTLLPSYLFTIALKTRRMLKKN
jgi:glycosyltransferase involved in cell wall biosynthesis